MLSDLIAREAQIIRRPSGERDDFSAPEPDPDPEDILCEIQQRSRTEPGDDGELSDTEWVAFFFPDAEVSGNDVLIVDGQRFELVGEPWLANSGSAAMHHVEATLRRTAGPGDTS